MARSLRGAVPSVELPQAVSGVSASPFQQGFYDAPVSRLGSLCLVNVNLAVSLGCNGLTSWPTDYRVNRGSGFQKRRIPVLRMVVGIANVAGDLELHMAHRRAEVALLKRRWRARPCNVL